MSAPASSRRVDQRARRRRWPPSAAASPRASPTNGASTSAPASTSTASVSSRPRQVARPVGQHVQERALPVRAGVRQRRVRRQRRAQALDVARLYRGYWLRSQMIRRPVSVSRSSATSIVRAVRDDRARQAAGGERRELAELGVQAADDPVDHAREAVQHAGADRVDRRLADQRARRREVDRRQRGGARRTAPPARSPRPGRSRRPGTRRRR